MQDFYSNRFLFFPVMSLAWLRESDKLDTLDRKFGIIFRISR